MKIVLSSLTICPRDYTSRSHHFVSELLIQIYCLSYGTSVRVLICQVIAVSLLQLLWLYDSHNFPCHLACILYIFYCLFMCYLQLFIINTPVSRNWRKAQDTVLYLQTYLSYTRWKFKIQYLSHQMQPVITSDTFSSEYTYVHVIKAYLQHIITKLFICILLKR